MAEQATCSVVAIAMVNHGGQWTGAASLHRGALEAAQAAGTTSNSKAQVSIYHNTQSNSYRVVALDVATNVYVINSPLTSDCTCRRDSPTFVSWVEQARPGAAAGRAFGSVFFSNFLTPLLCLCS
jgi:WH1 domain